MSEQQALDPKVIARIQKMLNLARCGGATEAEAETAMAHAEATMRKYNLTMAEVESTGVSGGEGSKRTKQSSKGKAQYEFQQQLMRVCAEVNYCVPLTNSVWKNRRMMPVGFTLIGREANVIAARELYDYLNATTERLAFEYVGSNNTRRLSRAAVSFKTGCAERLGERLTARHEASLAEQAREARQQNAAARHPGSTGTALAIVLRDFAQEEADRNNDLRWNLPEGTTGSNRAKDLANSRVYLAAMKAIKAAGFAQNRDELLGIGAAAAVAVAVGLSETDIHTQVQHALDSYLDDLREKELLEKETPAQRVKREEKEKRDNERFWNRHRRENAAKAARIDPDARDAGAEAGDAVGLDKQVKAGRSAPRLG